MRRRKFTKDRHKQEFRELVFGLTPRRFGFAAHRFGLAGGEDGAEDRPERALVECPALADLTPAVEDGDEHSRDGAFVAARPLWRGSVGERSVPGSDKTRRAGPAAQAVRALPAEPDLACGAGDGKAAAESIDEPRLPLRRPAVAARAERHRSEIEGSGTRHCESMTE